MRRAKRSRREGTAALLIIDSDLSFAFWLGHALDDAGYVSLPARSTTSAAELLYLSDVVLEVVIIEATLPDAVPFVMRLRQVFPGIKAVATLPENGAEIRDLSAYDSCRTKVRERDASAVAAWLEFIRSLSPPPPRRLHGAGL